MVTCLSPADFAYFMTLMADIVSVVGTAGDTFVVHAENGDVYWEKTQDGFCRILWAKT